jgi:hypothetical protein
MIFVYYIMVKLFTMVKDEVDIVRDWVIYHGKLFGFENLFIIDNYSIDGTYEILLEFSNLIHIFRQDDYKKKGIYISQLINKYCKHNEIAFPIDIDEFVAYYDNKEIIVDNNVILYYINNLPPKHVYKANYLYPILTNPNGHYRPQTELEYANYCNMGKMAKSFINTAYFKGNIDHGNHLQYDDYMLTNIVLLHYHHRNYEQFYKKNINNCIGLGYSLDINELKQTLEKTPQCAGNHHIITQIQFQEKTYVIPHCINPNKETSISIMPFKKLILSFS